MLKTRPLWAGFLSHLWLRNELCLGHRPKNETVTKVDATSELGSIAEFSNAAITAEDLYNSVYVAASRPGDW